MAEGFPAPGAREERLDDGAVDDRLDRRGVVAAASPLAGADGETTEAGQERAPAASPPPDGSSLPTQRPAVAPFAGLLAEAGAATRAPSEPPPPPPPPPPSPAEAPARSLGAYRILEEIGSGGMAIVYKALQPSVDRVVAIKELRPEFVGDRQITARFEREATSLATLQHGNIVHIYDYIKDVDSAYIVMEYVEGTDLFDLLHEVKRLPPEVAAIIALQLAAGLEYAHYHGIIHRDVKPSNLLISKLGEVKIMDFGIARDPGRADLTQVGMSLGTPAYMAPEQIRGDKVDFRADLFAFGIVLYEMLTATKPWGDDEGTTVARKVLYSDHVPPRQHVADLPAELARIIERCLQKEPDRRYGGAHELRREIEAYLARQVAIDPRQRLVLYLRNRSVLTDGEASGFVSSSALGDGFLRRRDLGLPPVEPRVLLRPVAIATAMATAAIGLALGFGLAGPIGSLEPLPDSRPKIQIEHDDGDAKSMKKRRSLASPHR